uniref:Uncharacterized protein n=1 Tax=Anguilla anguilla TaxID=7936 RepID=A0A0E9SVX8_ANGAN
MPSTEHTAGTDDPIAVETVALDSSICTQPRKTIENVISNRFQGKENKTSVAVTDCSLHCFR